MPDERMPDESVDGVDERLTRAIEEFSELDGREKLELLLDYASSLPPLSEDYAAKKEERRVHECQTPVYLWVELGGAPSAPRSVRISGQRPVRVSGQRPVRISGQRPVRLIAEVAEEAPTVKGFVSLLAEAVLGRPADEVLSIREDLLERLGLADVLGMMRARGLRAIVEHVKRAVVEQLGRPDA